ncbi:MULTISPECIES: VOC family protein [unclassified Pseudonocardia]|uniref:VOC family protein n=1 Tax=unclassified Pseudonocardia TaxID=2619320 RepID=UPI001CF6540F|nr:VOC family protein [Pseudonocardia sp. ICBG601]
MTAAIHHVELWTRDLAGTAPSFHWLFTELGWTLRDDGWDRGRIWSHPSGVYVVLEQSPAVHGVHDRTRPGLNHLALAVSGRARLDALRADCAAHGWSELFAGTYPHAGGPDHTALFVENAEGFEVELVAP